MKTTRTLINLIAFTAIAACGAEGPSHLQASDHMSHTSNDAAGDHQLLAGAFKLYPQARPDINTMCDRYTRLTLDGNTATLENALAGSCKIRVTPDPRTYSLAAQPADCGSRLYEGSFLTGPADAPVRIEVLDHRMRLCKDAVAAPVIVTEVYADGHTRTLYAVEDPAQALKSYTGRFVTMAAIGGDTTGYGLRLDDGRLIELDLATNGFHQQFVADEKVAVQGVLTEVMGIEIPTRMVLVVTSFSVL